jgi:hypothetical protein
MRSAVHHISGKEQPYPVYDFGQRAFVEKPQHNPFSGLGEGYEMLSDNFDRVELGDDWITFWPGVYPLPIIDNGVIYAEVNGNSAGAAWAQGTVLDTDHYLEVTIGYWSPTVDEPFIWLWARAKFGEQLNSGYYTYIWHSATHILAEHTRWDAPSTYTDKSTGSVAIGAGIPAGSIFRFETEGETLRTLLNRGSGWELIHESEATLYRKQRGVGIGLESFPNTAATISSIRAGNL